MKPISYSELQCWLQDRDEWIRRYTLGLAPEPTPAMNAGTVIHKWLQGTVDEVMEAHPLADAWRSGWKRALLHQHTWEFEKEVVTKVEGIPCRAFLDAYEEHTGTMLEIKTGSECWTPSKLKMSNQLPFYTLLLSTLEWNLRRGLLFTLSTKSGKTKLMEFPVSLDQTDKVKASLLSFAQWLKDEKLEDARVSSRERIAV